MCSYLIFKEGSSNHLEGMHYTTAELFHHSRSKYIYTLSSYQSLDSVSPCQTCDRVQQYNRLRLGSICRMT